MNKRLTLLITGLILVTALAGCSVIEGLGATPTPMVTPKPTLAPPSTPTATPEPRDIVELLPYQEFDPNTDPVAEKLAEVTGYDLQFVMLPQTGATEQIKIELSVGVDYDLISLTAQQFDLLAGKDVLTILDNLIILHAPALQAVYTQEEWVTATIEDHILGIPQFGSRYVDQGLVYDGTVAAEWEIDTPRTAEELKDALSTIKKKTDMTPLTGSGYRLSPIMSAFGLSTEWTLDEDTFINWIETDAFKEYLEYMVDLYEDGLVDTEWADNTAQTAAEKQSAGDAFAMVRDWNDPAALPDGHTAVAVAPLCVDGAEATFGVSSAPESFVVIPTTCSDPLMVMDYLELRCQADNIVLAAIGVEGVQYEMQGDSYVPLTGFSSWSHASVFTIAVPTGQITDLWLCSVREDAETYSVYTALNEGMASALVIEPVSFAPPIEAAETFKADLDAYVQEFFIDIITGEKTVKNDFDSFVARWKADGGQLIIDGYNEWKFGAPDEGETEDSE